ncbi:MAG: helix-destabilizing protein [Betaproteobacteria bacterium]|nr:helix-destabilizing protein [Betaproteobacteria bacterium]
MLKISVETSAFDLKQGTSAKTGKDYRIREQEAWAYTFDRSGKPNKHPIRVRLTLDDDQDPYQIGEYELDPASLYVDRFGQLALRARLRPVIKSAAKVA